MRRPGQFAAGISGFLLVFAGVGCFSPSFEPCAVSCGEADACPEGLVCLVDGMCHAKGDEELCRPGPDGSVIDGSIDPVDTGELPDASLIDAPEIDAPDVDAGLPVTPTRPGDLVITEIHKNPVAVGDAFGEWFELLNPTDRTFNLFGLRVNDLGADEFVIDESVIVPPGGRVVLARNADIGTNGGVAADYGYGTLIPPFQLGNAVDEIQIQNVDEASVIDTVAYDQDFPNTDGSSMSLSSDREDETANNDPANWCDGASRFGNPDTGDFGTPGLPNDPCVARN